MYKQLLWLVLIGVLLMAVGCTAETLPTAPGTNPPTQEPAAEPVKSATPTAEAIETDTPTVEPTVEATEEEKPTAEPTPADTPTAELIEEILESELLETPEQFATVTPLLEEVYQLELNPVKPGPEQLQRINFAKRDLAEKLGVDGAEIEVAAYEEAIWRDGSLGCPQPGMMYTQALVDGYVIQLVVDGQAYNYHGANGRDPFLCLKDGDESGGIPRDGFLATPPVSDVDV